MYINYIHKYKLLPLPFLPCGKLDCQCQRQRIPSFFLQRGDHMKRTAASSRTLKFGGYRKKQYFCNRNYKNTAL